MNLVNPTKKQHFLPQVEQRLNASNPNAQAHNNQRIFSFEVVDREKYQLRLESPRGRLISENLAIPDLFSFDVSPDKKSRMNFEGLFKRQEENVRANTENLLKKLANGTPDVSNELVNLFAAKLLNFSRNPFSITKILNTFGVLASYEPTDSASKIYFDKIINGRKPHQTRLCTELGITDSDYIKWLKLLFMLLLEYGEGNLTMLEGIVKSLFETKERVVGVMVCSYSEASCLVSDRAFSTNIRQNGIDGFDFNLCSRAFIRYTFADIEGIAPPYTAPWRIENYMKQPRAITLFSKVDDMDLLAGFNRNVIYQCYRRVYCSTKDRIAL